MTAKWERGVDDEDEQAGSDTYEYPAPPICSELPGCHLQHPYSKPEDAWKGRGYLPGWLTMVTVALFIDHTTTGPTAVQQIMRLESRLPTTPAAPRWTCIMPYCLFSCSLELARR